MRLLELEPWIILRSLSWVNWHLNVVILYVANDIEFYNLGQLKTYCSLCIMHVSQKDSVVEDWLHVSRQTHNTLTSHHSYPLQSVAWWLSDPMNELLCWFCAGSHRISTLQSFDEETCETLQNGNHYTKGEYGHSKWLHTIYSTHNLEYWTTYKL